MSRTLAEQLTLWLQPQLERYVTELTELCAIDSGADAPDGITRLADWVERWAAVRGWSVERSRVDGGGDAVTVAVAGRGRARVLYAAHFDTVYARGTAAARPLRRVGDQLIGPGCADDKSGVLSGLYAAAALAELAPQSFARITIFCGADEETTWLHDGPRLSGLAADHDVAFVLEAARENGDIVSSRKGSGRFTLQAYGRAAHAGVEPERGAHAILALAHAVIALQALNGARPGLTINVGTISGGGKTNVVPDAASCDIDVRIAHEDDAEPVARAMAAIAADSQVEGTRLELSGGWSHAPMARTAAIGELFGLAQRAAAELGFNLNEAHTGGVAYANLLAGAGVPVLDGLGPIGGNDHSPAEFLDIPSIVPRTALLALVTSLTDVVLQHSMPAEREG
jgi:glutamate carboxypeptidase